MCPYSDRLLVRLGAEVRRNGFHLHVVASFLRCSIFLVYVLVVFVFVCLSGVCGENVLSVLLIECKRYG